MIRCFFCLLFLSLMQPRLKSTCSMLSFILSACIALADVEEGVLGWRSDNVFFKSKHPWLERLISAARCGLQALSAPKLYKCSQMLEGLASQGWGLLGSGPAASMVCICSDLDTIGKGGVEKQNPDGCFLQVCMCENVIVMMINVVLDLDVARPTGCFLNGAKISQEKIGDNIQNGVICLQTTDKIIIMIILNHLNVSFRIQSVTQLKFDVPS